RWDVFLRESLEPGMAMSKVQPDVRPDLVPGRRAVWPNRRHNQTCDNARWSPSTTPPSAYTASKPTSVPQPSTHSASHLLEYDHSSKSAAVQVMRMGLFCFTT